MTAEMIAIGYMYQFEVFVKTPMWIFFVLFFMTSSVYILIAFFMSTIVTSKFMGFAINFSIILQSMVNNVVLLEPTVQKKLFFNLNNPDWVNYVTKVFYLNPCF